MTAMEALRIGVVVCGLGAAVALAVQAARARAYGRRPLYAPAAGSAARGVLYAFGPGMSPLAKESTRTHPWAYALGVAYHLGVFAAFGYCCCCSARSAGSTRRRSPAARSACC
ncbi:MAG: hypothetical protein IPM94_03315 [bacterium]|nr:hypothetical protein [bacterium]